MEKAILKGNKIYLNGGKMELTILVDKDQNRGWTGYSFGAHSSKLDKYIAELFCNDYPEDFKYVQNTDEFNKELIDTTYKPKKGNKVFYIRNLWVDPEFKRQRIATALYNYAKLWMKNNGLDLQHDYDFTDEGWAWRHSLAYIIKQCSELLQEPEHQALQSSEYKKTDITDEKELSTYPKNKGRANSEVKHITASLKFESDRIRLKYIQQAQAGKEVNNWWDSMQVFNKGDYLLYIEGWTDACWDALRMKPEYRNLDDASCISLFMETRFIAIVAEIGERVLDWTFDGEDLEVKISNSKNK